MSTTIRDECAGHMLGVEGRFFSVIAWPNGKLANQQFKATRYYKENGRSYRITAEVRFDDECRNGHESFAITADIREGEGKYWREYMGGCCHDEIAKRFPEFAPIIKWHLCSTDGPLHYLANTLYQAGDIDHNGLRKDEVRQIRNGKTGVPCWILEPVKGKPEKYVDSETQPAAPQFHYAPWNRVGEGKARELDHARSSAIWPEATDAELSQDRETLRAVLEARLPALMAEFKAAMIACGFIYPAE